VSNFPVNGGSYVSGDEVSFAVVFVGFGFSSSARVATKLQLSQSTRNFFAAVPPHSFNLTVFFVFLHVVIEVLVELGSKSKFPPH